MSYCQFSSGDVFMQTNPGGFIECCACSMAPMELDNMSDLAESLDLDKESCPELFEDFEMNGSLQFNTRSEALKHLEEHRVRGETVPEYAFERLRMEIAELGEEIQAIEL